MVVYALALGVVAGLNWRRRRRESIIRAYVSLEGGGNVASPMEIGLYYVVKNVSYRPLTVL